MWVKDSSSKLDVMVKLDCLIETHDWNLDVKPWWTSFDTTLDQNKEGFSNLNNNTVGLAFKKTSIG